MKDIYLAIFLVSLMKAWHFGHQKVSSCGGALVIESQLKKKPKS